MSVKRSKKTTIKVRVSSHERGLEKAIGRARSKAIMIHGIDSSGHCSDSDNFPRSSSQTVVEFVGMRFSMSMGGDGAVYEFVTWMENFDDE